MSKAVKFVRVDDSTVATALVIGKLRLPLGLIIWVNVLAFLGMFSYGIVGALTRPRLANNMGDLSLFEPLVWYLTVVGALVALRVVVGLFSYVRRQFAHAYMPKVETPESRKLRDYTW